MTTHILFHTRCPLVLWKRSSNSILTMVFYFIIYQVDCCKIIEIYILHLGLGIFLFVIWTWSKLFILIVFLIHFSDYSLGKNKWTDHSAKDKTAEEVKIWPFCYPIKHCIFQPDIFSIVRFFSVAHHLTIDRDTDRYIVWEIVQLSYGVYTTFNNISVIWWRSVLLVEETGRRSVLLVEETGIPRKKHTIN